MSKSFWPVKKGDRVWVTTYTHERQWNEQIHLKATVVRLIHYPSHGGRPPMVRVSVDKWGGRTGMFEMRYLKKFNLLDTLAEGAP